MCTSLIRDGLKKLCASAAVVLMFAPGLSIAASHEKGNMMDKGMAEEKMMDKGKEQMDEMKGKMKEEMPSEGMKEHKMDDMKAHDQMKDHEGMKDDTMSKEGMKEGEMKSEQMMKETEMKTETKMDEGMKKMDEGMKKNEMMK